MWIVTARQNSEREIYSRRIGWCGMVVWRVSSEGDMPNFFPTASSWNSLLPLQRILIDLLIRSQRSYLLSLSLSLMFFLFLFFSFIVFIALFLSLLMFFSSLCLFLASIKLMGIEPRWVCFVCCVLCVHVEFETMVMGKWFYIYSFCYAWFLGLTTIPPLFLNPIS